MSGFTPDENFQPTQTDLAGNPIDAIDVDGVKKERRSLTRGPMMVTLLFLATAIALVGLGGFWAYPAWQEIRAMRDETTAFEDQIFEKRQELQRTKDDNLKNGPSEVERAFAGKIAPVNDPAQNIRDIVRLVALDPSTPADDIQVRTFAFEEAKQAGDYVTVKTSLSVAGTAANVLRLLETANDPASGRRLASARTMNITFASAEKLTSDGSSPAEARFLYLLRQRGRHLMNADEERELALALDARLAAFRQTRDNLDKALQRVRTLERERPAPGVATLTRTDALEQAKNDVTRYQDELLDQQKQVQMITDEVVATLKVNLFAEQDPKAKKDPKAAAPATAGTPSAAPTPA